MIAEVELVDEWRRRRLVEVACRRLGGQTWRQIAVAMGFPNKHAAKVWSTVWIQRIAP